MISQRVRVAKPATSLYARRWSLSMWHIPMSFRAVSTARYSFLGQQLDFRVRHLNRAAFVAALLLCELSGCPKLSWSTSRVLDVTAERILVGVWDARGNLIGVTACFVSARDFSPRTVREAVTGLAPDLQGFCAGGECTGICPEKIRFWGLASITPLVSTTNVFSMIPAHKVGFTLAETYFNVPLDEWRRHLFVRSRSLFGELMLLLGFGGFSVSLSISIRASVVGPRVLDPPEEPQRALIAGIASRLRC